jgi:alpha-methylacyl-CoA racemase
VTGTDHTATGPLDGVRVLDLCWRLPGAWATAMLGDLGSDVIKVEPPVGGDPMRAWEPRIGAESALHWVTGRNKRSLALDLRTPRGAELVLELARTADVLIESARPGVMERLNLGYGTVHAINPAIVYCSISGHGSDGPRALEAGYDLNCVALSGALSVTGNDEPAMIGFPLADFAGGALTSVAGVLAALVRAQRTGEGDHVDIALTDGTFGLLVTLLGTYLAEGRAPGLGSERMNGYEPCYRIYACADGRHLAVAAAEEPFWTRLCDRLGRPDLIATRNDADAVPTWVELFRARPRDDWLALLAGSDTCVSPVNDLPGALSDPQLCHREMVVEQDHPTAGRTRQLGTPFKLREHPATIRTRAPAVGQDSRAVLAELGLVPAEIDRLIADGIAAEATR